MIATVPIGQAAQAVVYVPNALPVMRNTGNAAMSTMEGIANLVPEGAGTEGLEPLAVAGQAAHFTLLPAGGKATPGGKAPTSVTLFDQGLVQVLEASATGLEPIQPYVLALSNRADGGGKEPLSSFMTNPAGSAIVNAVGPIRQIVQGEADAPRRYRVIVPGSAGQLGDPVQVQAE